MHLLLLLCALLHMCHCTTTPSDEFDYIIVGGGTAGLVVANRLSADPSLRIAIIEAGDSVYNDSRVTTVSVFGAALGTELDWQYKSVPQENLNGRVLGYSAGKALGGTSAINGMSYVRAETPQIDAWAALGNPGWTWSALLPYYLRSEAFTPPTPDLVSRGPTFIVSAHGTSGNVKTGWSSFLTAQNFSGVLQAAHEQLGLPRNRDPNSGTMRGYAVTPMTLDAKTDIRSDSARAYLWGSAAERGNVRLFTRTLAHRIVWADGRGGGKEVRAVGVEVRPLGGKDTRIIRLNKSRKSEVVVSAGSLRSPALLEHSGVGSPALLKGLGIPVVVPLEGVGENFQDQMNTYMQWNSTVSWEGYPQFVTYLTVGDLFGKGDVAAVEKNIRRQLPDLAERIVSASPDGAAGRQGAVKEQLELLQSQADLIFHTDTPLAEVFWAPSGPSLGAAFWNLLPLGRGRIHILSKDPEKSPSLDGGLGGLEWDLDVHGKIGEALRRLFGTASLKSVAGGEIIPGTGTVKDGDVSAWRAWMRNSASSNNHPVSTLAMMSRDRGGCVSPELKVYATANVRAVDASVFPTQVSGHLTSTLYAIAEKAAEDILKSRRK